MTELEQIGTGPIVILGVGAAISFIVPILIAIIWKVWKNERFTTILVGAATFFVFAIMFEKPIQSLVIGVEHPVSIFLNAHPLLLSLVVALFPGIFEETGRFVAYKTILKNRKNKETGISHGIGHGGMEVMFITGITYISYIAMAIMINHGTFQTDVIDAVQSAAEKEQYYITAQQIATFRVTDLILVFVERLFACLFHLGASIIVFFAVRDKKIWLFLAAIALHTLMDFAAAVYMLEVVDISPWAVEVFAAILGSLTFCGAFFLLYKKDKSTAVAE